MESQALFVGGSAIAALVILAVTFRYAEEDRRPMAAPAAASADDGAWVVALFGFLLMGLYAFVGVAIVVWAWRVLFGG